MKTDDPFWRSPAVRAALLWVGTTAAGAIIAGLLRMRDDVATMQGDLREIKHVLGIPSALVTSTRKDIAKNP